MSPLPFRSQEPAAWSSLRTKLKSGPKNLSKEKHFFFSYLYRNFCLTIMHMILYVNEKYQKQNSEFGHVPLLLDH